MSLSFRHLNTPLLLKLRTIASIYLQVQSAFNTVLCFHFFYIVVEEMLPVVMGLWLLNAAS